MKEVVHPHPGNRPLSCCLPIYSLILLILLISQNPPNFFLPPPLKLIHLVIIFAIHSHGSSLHNLNLVLHVLMIIKKFVGGHQWLSHLSHLQNNKISTLFASPAKDRLLNRNPPFKSTLHNHKPTHLLQYYRGHALYVGRMCDRYWWSVATI